MIHTFPSYSTVHIRRFLSLCLCCWLFAGITNATEKLQKADLLELSNNAVLCMHQDLNGDMWFGTYDGLNFFNGKNTFVFRYEPDNETAINGNIIQKIINADSTHLWIATSIGVNLFSIPERKVVTSFPNYPESRLLAADITGNTLLLSVKNFISYYSPAKGEFQDILLPEMDPADVKELFVDKNNQFRLLTSQGILKQAKLNPHSLPVAIDLVDQKIHDLEITDASYTEGVLFFVDKNNHLFLYSPDTQEKRYITDINKLKERYGEGGGIAQILRWHSDIYIAFKNNGLVKLEEKNPHIPQPIYSHIGLFCLHKDNKQDILWLGTDGQGVQMYYEKQEMFGNILTEDLSYRIQKPIRAIYTDDQQTLWLGTKGDGVLCIRGYDKKNLLPHKRENISHYTTSNGLSNNMTFCFLKSQYKNILWIGTEGPGLSYYSYADQQIHTVKNPFLNKIRRVHSLCEINDSTLWIATAGDGLIEVHVKEDKNHITVTNLDIFTFRRDNKDCNEFHSMSYDGDSILYIGSRGGYGVVRFHVIDKEYRFLSLDKTASSAIGDVLCVHKTTPSLYYFGASSGLTQMSFLPEGENRIKQFDKKNGIANDMIHGILEDNTGCIWLSTNKGLTKYNPHNDFFHNYYYPDLRVTEFSDDAYWKCTFTDRLFFGGINGLVWVDPTENITERYTPDLRFWELTCLNKKQTITGNEQINIPSKASSFSISFVATDYINGDNYEYSYFLENYNTSWVELQKNNEVTFTNLPPGKYLLHVKYKNDVYDSNANTYLLPILVLPPWYLTKWAIALYVFSCLFLMAYIIFLIRRRIMKRQTELAHRIKEEQKEKLYEAKLHFFTNITHELCTPLTLINGVGKYIQEYTESMPDNKLKKQVYVLNNNIDELNTLIQEILDFRKIEESGFTHSSIRPISISGIVRLLFDSFLPMARKNNIDFKLTIADDLYWNTDKAAFKKILNNLISNAFKYTPEAGIIHVSLAIRQEELVLKVYNTGQGIKESQIDAIFDRYQVLEHVDENKYMQLTARNGLGLPICKGLVDSLQGQIHIQSEVGEYAEICVSLPRLEPTQDQSAEPKKEMTQPVSQEKTTIDNASLRPTILLIDDNKDILWFISSILSPTYDIKEATNGVEAIKIIEKQSPALIITDIMMPQMDGWEFIQTIKANKFTKHIPLVVVSAKITEKEQAEGLDLGADAYITKPFSPLVLTSTINRLISHKNELKEYYHSPESAYEYTEGNPLHQEDKEFMDTVTAIIQENIDNEILRPEFIAEKLGLNTRNLYRRFKKISSLTPSDYIKDYRFIYAAQLLINTNLSIQEVIYKVGISNKSYFYREFQKKYGMSPKDYRSQK
ncbi:signal transduction histidine kinase/CheY-like chemotaxis protein/AraC-like DNA-binding protein [Parabacteroides sp. PM5-20]|uniref:hybrid sensor histidine kinase/response regulator transcription factor n=1 Tax=Parabacteroides sp. PM5-20 TaxID=2940527 RepID=UPI002476D04D|nr:hybrid sensor histidine kinase/response regulator transcription factor [Parabacteroides sp. PM5-20]MDH6534355.1 signal transduction histidine kinase/CheY-like chemotaxis protein/AraC-like DNA-binding protein [Parabacteroides sp. PM5-20]